jgi:arsenite-transporting ATPase
VKLESRKFFFLSGKGGVGKSTLASALALKLALKGFRTLLVSLDPAHSLSTLFQRELSSSPTELYRSLYGVELELEREMKSYLERVEREAERIVSPAILGEVKRQIELAYYSPGGEELALVDSIYRIGKGVAGEFDKVVFDTAPSGYTVRLMALPDKLIEWINGLIRIRKEALKYLRLSGKEVEGDEVLSLLEGRKEEYLFLSRLFTAQESLFALVVNPGKLPVQIGLKSLKELEEGGVKVEAVFLNRWRNDFPVPKELSGRELFVIPQFEKEPIGLQALLEVAEYIP